MDKPIDRWIVWSASLGWQASLYGTTDTREAMIENLKRSKKHGDRVSGYEIRRITVWPLDWDCACEELDCPYCGNRAALTSQQRFEA